MTIRPRVVGDLIQVEALKACWFRHIPGHHHHESNLKLSSEYEQDSPRLCSHIAVHLRPVFDSGKVSNKRFAFMKN